MSKDIAAPRPPPLRSSLMGTSSARGTLFGGAEDGPGSATASPPAAGSLLQATPSFLSRGGQGGSTELPRLRALTSSGRFSDSGGGSGSADKAGSRGTISFGSGRASETGDGNKASVRPGPHPGMRRSSTMIGATRLGNAGMEAAAAAFSGNAGGGQSSLVPSPPTAARESGSGRDRATALQQDRHALLLNKRRLEALLTKVLEQQQQQQQQQRQQQQQQQQPQQQQAAGASAATRPGSPPELEAESAGGMRGGSSMAARGAVVGGGLAAALRSQIVKALDDSAVLDRQLLTPSPPANVGGARSSADSFATVDTDARVRELTAAIDDMKLDHEVALSRLEGELKYRNTQSSAAASGLQKQLSEAEEELSRVRRQLAAAEGRVRDMTATESALRRQVSDLSSGLEGSRAEVAALKDLIGIDKGTLHTVVSMLKQQLKDAHGAGAAKSQRISELEYQIVRRDTLLAEATQQRLAAEEKATAALSAAAAAATAAPAGGSGGVQRQGSAAAAGDAYVVVGAARSSCSGAGNNGGGAGSAARRLVLGVLGESFSAGEEAMMLPAVGMGGGIKANTAVGGYNVYHSSAGQVVFD
ncbi:hypothetical protein HYH02_010225 [Chlamydomonas schloesseri]|uniref:Uncharacterized protein n=1 Tax=Chlamydomonas schloesseri TaxID=2026947 RepID=A0A835TL56_9CHLO|nr:hypothetical protein HYH02_010225 [Chlamydomonas schloesseri]|eukprot:KAG2440646.1 hypothetical protein HYH02_010225 [Chlamydomonas schloesseri]